MTIDVTRFNHMRSDEARRGLLLCCECEPWADGVLARRPFAGPEDLLDCAREVWFAQPERVVVDALNRKPRIGEGPALRLRPDGGGYHAVEQSGVEGEGDAVLQGLFDLNDCYDRKFGFIFVICASGRRGRAMLEALRQRLQNDRETELRTATDENHQITVLRLNRWLNGSG